MSENITENEIINEEKIDTSTKVRKKTITIMGLSIWRIFAYFIIYSIVGYIIETVFGIITKGVWESRQSFLYGPVCAIYGLGASIMLIFLHKYNKRYNILFFGGFLLGSIIEYVVSLIGELILHVKWWDYSDMPLNINGRICVYFSIFWGFLALYLIVSFNPKIDKLINWIKSKFSLKSLRILTLSTIIILFIDCIITGIAMSYFLIRMIVQNDLDVPNKQAVQVQYDKIYSNEKLSRFIYKYWGDRKMIRTFPNIKVTDVNGNIIYISGLLKDIPSHYLKIHEPKKIDFTKHKLNLNG